MSFVHPALLAGALLFAVPLVIHLLNRQRYKRRSWAAMEFLLAAYKKQRRRLRAENLLLLLLRCLIPIVVALAIARPVLQDAIGPQLGRSAHHVLVLDRSYSMGLRPEGAQSPHLNMKQLASELLDRLEEDAGSKASLVLAGIRPSMPVLEDLNLTRARAEVAALDRPEDTGADLVPALEQVANLLEQAGDPDAVVYVFTDFQARAFGESVELDGAGAAETAAPPSGEELFRDDARDMLERIGEQAEVVLIDVGMQALDASVSRAPNLQVSGLELGTTAAVAGAPTPVVVTLRNLSDAARDVAVTLEIDGDQPTVKSTRLEAGAEGQLEFLVTFRRTGQRWLGAHIEGDGLDPDDQRWLVVRVRDRLRVLVVEGSAETEEGLMEGELIRSRLDPTRGEGPPSLTVFAPEVVDTVSFLSGQVDPRSYDVVVLADVPQLVEAPARSLLDAMRGGTALFVMFGPRSQADSYNVHLHGAGRGPMPFELSRVTGFAPMGDQYYTAEITAPDHPIFEQGFVEDVYHEIFELTPIYRFWSTLPPDAEGDIDSAEARVLARVRDPDLSPLLVASHFGNAKALFLTSPWSDRPDRWNRFDVQIMSFPLVHESVKWLTLPVLDSHNVVAGRALTAPVRGRPMDVAVVLPERAGGGKALMGEDPEPLAGALFALPPFRATEDAGVYTVEMRLEERGQRRDERLLFAVNPDPAEGDLSYLPHDVARERLRPDAILRRLPTARGAQASSGSNDLGLPLLWLALALLVGEAALARFVTWRRS